uniref:Major facilitator superfamily (MFS) profile domain-containing protein n=1 Tax=Ciona intestinalis TaxID=7719 RepID=F6UF11_CIOIN
MDVCRQYGNIVATLAHGCINKLRDLTAPLRDRISDGKSQRKLVLVIVCVALLLDNMLYMVIVPIITEYFNKNETKSAVLSTTSQIMNDFISTPYINNATPPAALQSHLQTSGPDKDGTEDTLTGILFASKAIVQLMANPFTGTFIDRVGYIKPLTLGLMVMFLSTALFACAEGFAVLFLARSLQGLGSALADTASLGLIADRFQDEAERSKALGLALAFISFGSLVAPPFGGILYEFAGREWPFLILAFVCLIDAMLLLLVQIPREDETKAKVGNLPVGTPIYKLFIDPYIAVIAAALMAANFPLAFLEPTIAKWMHETMGSSKWQIGLVWLPAFLPHLLGVYLTVRLSVKYFRFQWLYGAIGLLLIGVSTAAVPTCHTYGILMIPLAIMCFGIALIDTALLPTMAFLVDVRHTSVYGSVYAIVDISYSVAYSLGPILAGQAVQKIGYLKMNVAIGLANMLFSPLLIFLREVYDWKPDKSERAVLIEEPTVNSDCESPESNVSEVQKQLPTQSDNSLYVVQRPRTRQGSVVSSEDDESPDIPNRRFSKSDALKITNHPSHVSKYNVQSAREETFKSRPRPQPRMKTSVKKSAEQHPIGRYNTTVLNGENQGHTNDISNKYNTLTTSLSKGEFTALADSGLEVRNPCFENDGHTYQRK